MVFVCGDTHFTNDTDKLFPDVWPEGQKCNKKDYLIILGDAGIIWFLENCEREQELLEWYNSQLWTTLFIDGNHENFDRLFSNSFPEIDMFNSKVKQIHDSIFYLQRGHVYTIEKKTFFAFGGGESIDKNARSARIDWWEQELPNHHEMDFAIGNLKRHNEKVDFVLTHACSDYAFNLIMKFADFSYKRDTERSLRSFFFWIENNIHFGQWHFAHYHDDYNFGKYYLHYNNKPMRIV